MNKTISIYTKEMREEKMKKKCHVIHLFQLSGILKDYATRIKSLEPYRTNNLDCKIRVAAYQFPIMLREFKID